MSSPKKRQPRALSRSSSRLHDGRWGPTTRRATEWIRPIQIHPRVRAAVSEDVSRRGSNIVSSLPKPSFDPTLRPRNMAQLGLESRVIPVQRPRRGSNLVPSPPPCCRNNNVSPVQSAYFVGNSQPSQLSMFEPPRSGNGEWGSNTFSGSSESPRLAGDPKAQAHESVRTIEP